LARCIDPVRNNLGNSEAMEVISKRN